MAFIEMDFASGGSSKVVHYDNELKPLTSSTPIGFKPKYVRVSSFFYNGSNSITIIYDESVSTTQYKLIYNGVETMNNIGDVDSSGFISIGENVVINNANLWGYSFITAYA